MVTSVNAGSRLDRLPIGPFHRRIMFLIGIGMFFDGFDIYLAGTVLGVTLKTGFSTLPQNAIFISATFVGMMLGSFATGFLGDLDEFGKVFANIFTEITPMVEIHARLRRQGFKTYIFSNTNDLAIGHIRQNFPFFENFDGYILSYEIKAMKPDAPIYAALEQMTGKRGHEIVYIDDRDENVTGGAARGWRTILHETPEKTRSAMKLFGF